MRDPECVGLQDNMTAPASVEPYNALFEQSPCAALRAAARAVTQLYDLVLTPTGLKATQFVILRAIHQSGEIVQCQFARDHTVAVETLSRRFQGLSRKGYIQVRTGNRHGERIYTLTEKGKAVLDAALPYWQRAEQRLRKALGESEWTVIAGMLERVRIAALDAQELRMNNHVS